MTKLTAKIYLESKGLSDHDYMDSGMINHISEMMEEYHQHKVTLGLPSVMASCDNCRHLKTCGYAINSVLDREPCDEFESN
jgi:hypothetical protein